MDHISDLSRELLDYFTTFLQDNRKKNQSTVANIFRDVKNFLIFLGEQDITAKAIEDYLDEIQDEYTHASFITKVSSLRQFTYWLDLPNNPLIDKDYSIKKEDIKYLTEEQLATRFESSEFNYDLMIIRVIYELCLSLQELTELKISDYNLASSSFRLRNKIIKISNSLGDWLKAYIRSERQEILAQAYYAPQMQDPLFIRTDGKLKASHIINILQGYDLKTTLLKRSRIINLLQSGLDFDDVENLLGIRVSEFYTPFIKEKPYRLWQAYTQYHPRALKT